MKNRIFNAVLITILTLVLFVIFVNTPAKYFSLSYWFPNPVLGTVVLTDISSGDSLSAYPTVQNANSTILENVLNTIIGTTSISTLTTAANLVTVGALSSGSLSSGFTAVTVPLGGTGSTTLQQYAVLVGSSTNPIHAVDGLGTSGQFLTSNGTGAKPSWQTASVNQNIPYTWTAHHIFSSLFATNASTTNATSTHFALPGILSSLLKTDSNGKVAAATAGTDYLSPSVVLKSYSQASVTMTTAATWYQVRQNIGVGTFTATANDSFRIETGIAVDSGSGQEKMVIEIGNGTASTTLSSQTQNSVYDDLFCTFDIFLRGATNSWNYKTTCFLGATVQVGDAGTSVVDLANGFNISASSTNNTQAGRIGTSEHLRVERIR